MVEAAKIRLETIYSKLKNKKNKTYISRDAQIAEKVFFEGNNYVGARTFLLDCQIGEMSYLSMDDSFAHTKIGKYCSIGPECKVVYGNHPTSKFVTTHPAFYTCKRPAGICYVTSNKFAEIEYADSLGKRIICIGNDVWLATGVMITGGVTIGNGAIIAAGSVVTKDIPPYAFAGGAPAQIIRYRFNKEQIAFLQNLQWWNKGEEWIKRHAEYFEDINLLMRIVKQEESRELDLGEKYYE